MPMQIRRTYTANNPPPPASLREGQLACELASVAPRLWIGVPNNIDPSGQRLVIDSSLYVPSGGGDISGDFTFIGSAPQLSLNNPTANWIAWPTLFV